MPEQSADRFLARVCLVFVALLLAGLLVACASATSQSTLDREPTQAPVVAIAPSAASHSQAVSGTLRLVLVPSESEVRYRVREQLARLSLPSDAVGITKAISGALVLEPDGIIVPDQSRFVVDLRTLASDESRRDNYVHRNTLETDRFPTAEFVPTEVRGVASPLPTSGDVTFQLMGDLTLHGVTHPTTWAVTAHIEGQDLTGSASTDFTFDDFNLRQPRVPLVLSVEETIRLELDFRLVRES
ncbi:MAG: YceI family protein [Ardenticatenaceae bacterium]|nr:YceI family protein [Ardenticatenaceae bacterium]HBY98956.1 hypothetical protein [Chloroflexota bacterium]